MERLVEAVMPYGPLPTAVVAPHEASALAGALQARDLGLITPILIGDLSVIRALAKDLGADLGDLTMVQAKDTLEAADLGVACVRDGRARALMNACRRCFPVW